ncbi:hypothetical protein B0G71_2288 [Paraburkholderia sp. BL27I4N3]|uniref:hypothetical protein n=1 Tax=Paraburkholderia sp. BL27I4N3 TaxID=1938805 RepID=UPI000E372A4C|nr:hypothetical protein [Paraburkholderia sp. BL27I4N3]REE19213.1 hypothetical protein B0G71_2288 [Paraburkholderia sp. BL27I4N3]
MKNLNKGLLLFFASFVASHAWAANVLIFDSPNLIGVDDNGFLSGFYSANNGKTSCFYLFVQRHTERNLPDSGEYSAREILTFTPQDRSFLFGDRNKDYDIGGYLYGRGDTMIIRTSKTQAGCGNAMGAFEFGPEESGAFPYTVEKRIPAIGIRLIKNRSLFYDYKDGKFVARKGYLTKWDGVVVLRTRDRFSYVRFADPGANVADPGRVTTGWIHSADLVNPFPPSTNKDQSHD